MSLPALALTLGRLLPAAAPYIVSFAGVLGLTAYRDQLQEAAQRSELGDQLTRLLGLRDLEMVLTASLQLPFVAQALLSQGRDPIRVQQDVAFDLATLRAAEFAPGALPTFADLTEAQRYATMMETLWAEGLLSTDLLARARAHAEDESIRLRVGISPLGLQQDPGLVLELAVLPFFGTLASMDAFALRLTRAWQAGYLTDDGLARINTHLGTERDRLMGISAAALPAPAPALPAPGVAALPTVAPAAGALLPSAAAPAGVLAGIPSPIMAQTIAAIQAHLAQLVQVGVVTQAQVSDVQAAIAAGALAAPMPAGGALSLPGVEGLLRPLGAILAGTGVGSLASALGQVANLNAGPNAHGAQQALYGCQGSFAGPLLGVASRLLPQILAGSVLMFDSPIRQQLQKLVEGLIFAQLDPEQFKRPTTYEEAVDNASKRLLQAIGFGLQAQGIAYTAEAMTPLKQMGFAQLAGFMGDVAGFGRIAAGLMGTVESAAIYRPLQYEANRRFRPTLPSDGLLVEMFEKYAITWPEVRAYLERSGLPDDVLDRYPEILFRDIGVGELSRLFQHSIPDLPPEPDENSKAVLKRAGIAVDKDWFIKTKLAKSRLSPSDIKAFTPVVKMASLRREFFLRSTQITALYREGFIDKARARKELLAALQPTDRIEYRLVAMDLQTEFEVKDDLAELVGAAYDKGVITEEEVMAQLTALGMDQQRAQIRVLRKRLGLVKRITEGPAPEAGQVPVLAGVEE